MAGSILGRFGRLVVTASIIAVVMFASSSYIVGTAQASTHEITECTTIETPGSYVLTQDIVNATEDHCITINASDVTIDGQGHMIDGVGKRLFGTPFSSGILAEGTVDNHLRNITVKNVTVREWENGVTIRYVVNANIVESEISDNIVWSIRLADANNASIVNNYISNSSRGIYHTVLGVESRTVIEDNVMHSPGYGITFDGDSSLAEDNHIVQNTINDSRYGVFLLGSLNSTIASNYIANSSTYGIWVGGANNTVEDNHIVDSESYGIRSSGVGSVLESNSIRRSGSWDVYASHDVTVNDLDINSTVSFTGFNIKIRSANDPGVTPAELASTRQFVEVSQASTSWLGDLDSWIFLNVSYTDQDVTSNGINENSLRLYQFNGTEWAIAPDPNGVNDVDNYVYANLSNYSVIAPFGESEAGVTEVNISIKPSDDPNAINPTARGVIPVAILNTSEIDPDHVNVSTLRFGAPGAVDNGSGAQPSHGGHFEDIDEDGDRDLVIHFPTRDAGFDSEDTEGKLVGEMVDGMPIVGTDSVTIVGKPA